MIHQEFDLAEAARQEMIQDGFAPAMPPQTSSQLAEIEGRGIFTLDPGIRDLRNLLWSSIDNDTSRDLDQIEYVERVPQGIRVLVGIADVDCAVPKGSPIDNYAANETTTVYTAVRN